MNQRLQFTESNAKNLLLDSLDEEVVKVTFTKADGTERTMKATRNFALIPAEALPKSSGRAENPDVCPVFDVEAQGWRSFRYDSIKQVEWFSR